MLFNTYIGNFWLYLSLFILAMALAIFLHRKFRQNAPITFIGAYTLFLCVFVLFTVLISPAPIFDIVRTSDPGANFLILGVIHVSIPVAYFSFLFISSLMDRKFRYGHKGVALAFIAVTNQIVIYYFLWMMAFGGNKF